MYTKYIFRRYFVMFIITILIDLSFFTPNYFLSKQITHAAWTIRVFRINDPLVESKNKNEVQDGTKIFYRYRKKIYSRHAIVSLKWRQKAPLIRSRNT